MKFATIITPANIEVEYRLAGAGSRLAAFLIDFILQMLAILLIAWVVLRVTERFEGTVLAFIIVTGFVIHFGYFIVCELTMNGQSIGKRVFGLRVIRDNGQPIEFTQSLVRGLIRSSVDMMYVGLFTILFSKNHKRLGDMAAGTIVISEKHASPREPSLFGPQYQWPADFPDSLALSVEERNLVEEWLRRKDDLPDVGVEIGRKFREYFKSKGEEQTI
ncbi:MAG: RDD family protein [Defluviitaleaceae bacterium]|nr:RDD family protein [Defluviitaleaceae bacterium]